MKCPHCLHAFHNGDTLLLNAYDKDGSQNIKSIKCTNCERFIVLMSTNGAPHKMIYPKGYSRGVISTDVPDEFSEDYKESCLVIDDSSKASAALSRRCLQLILRDVANVKPQDLSKEIDEVLASGQLPSHLSEAIDAVRTIGNFAAHPTKNTNTGEIVPVETGEAEWLLDVLEGLFDFYFVQPAHLKSKKDALNKKLQDAGKPLMK